MMNKKIIGIALFAASFTLGQSAFAHDDSGMCNDRYKNMVSVLKLDSAQQAKVKIIRDQLKASQSSNWKQMKDIGKQIDQLVQSDKMDEAKLDSLVNQKSQLIGASIKAKSMAENQIYTMLNSQQKAQYPQMVEQREARIKSLFKKCDE